MPVKNPTTTWYRLPPPQSHASPRHPNQPSKPPQPQTPTQHNAQTAPTSPRHAPPHHFVTGLQLKHPTTPGASQIPGVRTPTGHSAHTSPVLPSKLPTSTSSSPNTSPKRTVEPQPSKIASPTTLPSPTKLKHADRLPPVVARSSSGTEQAAAPSGRPGTPKLRGRVVKEKTNENKPRKNSENAKVENKDAKKKEKNDGKRPREPEVPKKKPVGTEAKAEPKAIPKRKKSERSNSDHEIKPKKMVAKEHPTSPSKPEEPHEKVVPRQTRGKTPEKSSPSPTKEPRRIPPAPKLSHPRPQSLRKEAAKPAEKSARDAAALRKDAEKKGGGGKKQIVVSGDVSAKAEKKNEKAENTVADVVDESKDDDDDLEEDESIEGEYTLKDDDNTVEGDTGTDLSDMSIRSAEGAAKGVEATKEVPALVCPPEDNVRDEGVAEDDRKSGIDVNESSLSESLFTIEDSDRSGAFKDDCSTKYFSTVDDDLSMKEVSIDEDPSLEIAMSDDQSMKDDLMDDHGMRDDFLDDLIMKDCLLEHHGMKDDLLETLRRPEDHEMKDDHDGGDHEMKEHLSEECVKEEGKKKGEEEEEDHEMKEHLPDEHVKEEGKKEGDVVEEDHEMKEHPLDDHVLGEGDKADDHEMKEHPSDDHGAREGSSHDHGMKENPSGCENKKEAEEEEVMVDQEMKDHPPADDHEGGNHENDHEMKEPPSDDQVKKEAEEEEKKKKEEEKKEEDSGGVSPENAIEDETMKEEEKEEEGAKSENVERKTENENDGEKGEETLADKREEEGEENRGKKDKEGNTTEDHSSTMIEEGSNKEDDNSGRKKEGNKENGEKKKEEKEEKKKTKEEGKVTERRSKRKMETERTRGGTKKPARLFVEKDLDKLASASRPVSPCPSDLSSSSDLSHASRVSSRLPIRALHASGPARTSSITSLCSTASGGGSRGSRESRVLNTNRASTTTAEKKRQEAAPPPRRPRLDNIKSTIPKPGRLPPRKLTDPVKAARPVGPTSGPRGPHVGHGGSGPGQQHPVPHAEQLRRLEAEVAARAAEVKAARAERDHAGRGVEALSVIIHHLTHTYEPFQTPCLKAEVVRLTAQLTETRLNLDESTAAVRRLQEAAEKSVSDHEQKVQQLEQKHRQSLEQLNKQHQHELDLVLEKQRKDMAKFAEEQQVQREDLSRAHKAELEQMEGEWRSKLDIQHEKHLCAVQELNTRHTQKLRELESSRRARESELEIANERLIQEQEALKLQSKKLEETLLNDTDHRLLAMRRMCTSLKSEVESLKTVVEMRNAEIHELRGQVVEMDRLSNDLELAREKSKSLQAKTEDLQAQMEKRSMAERHLVNEHRLLIETYQRESNINKRLSLENEELAWKLRQREEIMSTSMPSSTLDLVSRSPAPARRQEGASSPQAAPRSPRVAVRTPSGKVSPSKHEASKRRSRLGLTPEDGMNGDSRVQEVSLESPPPSPCVKAVVEKSNSVSFILDLNDSQSDDSFLDLPPSPRPRPHRTASLSAADRPRTPTQARRVMHNNRTNSLNKNGIHMDGKSKNMNGRPKDFLGKTRGMNGKGGEMNGKSLDSNGHSSQQESGCSASESSEGGSEVERVSPTGLAWTVPVHKPKSPTKGHAPRQNGSPVRGRIEHHLLEDPEEDEYEETPTHQFIEVVELSGVGLNSSSEAASDSELSQCDLIKDGSSTDSDSESSEGEHHKQGGTGHQSLAHKGGPWCPKEGAGEAMITDELLKQYAGEGLTLEAKPAPGKRPLRRRIPSAPSSDSDDNNMNAHNNGTGDVSWSEDVDITSSSEMHEL